MNDDYETPIRTKDEDVGMTGVEFKCQVNVNHKFAYLFEPETTPFFSREYDESLDNSEDSDEKHFHKCNITERYERDESSDDNEEEEEVCTESSCHKYLYTVIIDAVKYVDGVGFKEQHEVENVPRRAIQFVNVRYTSDVFLKNSFRHEMILPDDVFPKAWMNLS